MMLKFGCSQRMATQEKQLFVEKGILSTPNPKMGKVLKDDTVKAVTAFHHEDDISRTMPGEKDCFSISKDGEKVKVKETYALFKEKYPEKK